MIFHHLVGGDVPRCNKNPFAVEFGRAMDTDPSYGSSSFGIVIIHLVDGNQLQVLCAGYFEILDSKK